VSRDVAEGIGLMEALRRFERAIGSKMALVSLGCVALGVLFPQAFGPLEVIVPALFAIMTFQGSLNNTFRQLAHVFRDPRRLLVILAVNVVGMPLVARILAGAIFGGDPNLVTGIVLEYSVPIGVVSYMWIGMYGGNTALGLAAILVSTVLSPFTIPLGLQLLLGQTVQVDVMGMMTSMIFMIALPALAGMVVNDATHGWGRETLSPNLSPISKILLMVIITANATGISDFMRNLTPVLVGVMAFILVFATSGFLWGLVAARLGGESLPNLVTMCFDCGIRNISAGAVLAAAYFPPEVMFPVMMGTLFQQVLAASFGTIMSRIVAGGGGGERGGLDQSRRP
jgi:predicted Na+-dependent transporter